MDSFKKNKDILYGLESKCKTVLLTGIDQWLKKNFVSELLMDVSSESNNVDFYTLYLDDLDFGHLMNIMNVKSLFASKKVLHLIGDAKFLTKKYEITKPKKKKVTFEEMLVSLIEDAKNDLFLVLDFESLDKRKKLYKTVSDNGLLLEMKPLSEKQLMAFCHKYIKKQGSKIDDEPLKYFLSLIDLDMYNIISEMNKLCSYSDDIAKKDIDELVVKSAKIVVFDLIDEVSKANRKKSLILLNDIFMAGNSPFQVLSLLALHYERLLLTLLYGKRNDSELAKLIKSPPFFVKKYREQASQLSVGFIHSSIDKITDTEVKLKSGYKNGNIIMSSLIMELCRGVQTASKGGRKNVR